MKHASEMIRKYPDLDPCLPALLQAYETLVRCYRQGGKLLICGNGGSAADSEHIVAELMKGYLCMRPLPAEARRCLVEAAPQDGAYLADHLQSALPAISLSSHHALLTAFSNDVAPDLAFAQQVYGYGKPGDVLLAISTSGNSKNILHAVQVGRAINLHTVGLTGRSGGALKRLCEIAICVPYDRTPDIQERHLAVYHTLCAMLEETFFETA